MIFLSFKTRKSLYQGGDFGQDLSVLSLLLSQACLQASHFLFELSDGVFFVHVHRLQHLQLCTQLSVLQLSVFQVNLEGGGIKYKVVSLCLIYVTATPIMYQRVFDY